MSPEVSGSLSTGFYGQRIRPKVHKDWKCCYPLQSLISWRSSTHFLTNLHHLPSSLAHDSESATICPFSDRWSAPAQTLLPKYNKVIDIIFKENIGLTFVCKRSWKTEINSDFSSEFSLPLLAVHTSLQLGKSILQLDTTGSSEPQNCNTNCNTPNPIILYNGSGKMLRTTKLSAYSKRQDCTRLHWESFL